jgi:hypothetical protein
MITVGKLLMSIAIAIYAFIPPIVDLMTDSHVFHQEWMPHARMHTVWLLGITSGVGVISLYLIWGRRTESNFNINLAVVLSAIVYGAFFLSASTISLYGGALSDEVGDIETGPLGFDANLFGFSVASLILVSGWVICARNRI